MRLITDLWRRLGRPLLYVLVFGTVVAGCASAPTQPKLSAYDAPSDRCNTHRQPLIATSEELDKWDFMKGSMGKGALGGALIGVIGGLIVGGDAKSAAIGGAAGAAGGAAAGAAYGYNEYLHARQEQTQSRQALIDGINGDAQADTARVQEVTDSIRKLGTCRREQVDEIKAELKRGSITKEQALARADTVKAASAEDSTLIEEVLGKVDKRYETYVDAKAEVLKVDRTEVAASQPTQEQIAAIKARKLMPMSGTYRVVKGANIRKGPTTGSAKLGYLPANREIAVTGATSDGKWYVFDHKGETAFVYASLVKEAKPKDEVIDMGQVTQVAHNVADEEDESLDLILDGLYTAIGEEEKVG